MSALAELMAERVAFTFDSVATSLKSDVAKILIRDGYSCLVPESYGGTAK